MASDATKQTINQSLIDLKAEVADRTKSVITGVKIPELEDTRIISNTDQLIIETGDGTKRTTMRAFGDFVGTGLATPKEVQDARGNYPQLGDRLDVMDNKIVTNEQNIQNNTQQIENNKQEIQNNKQQIENNKQEIQNNKQEITNLKNKQDTLSKEVEEARKDNKTPNTTHNSLKERLDSDYNYLNSEIEKTNTQLSAVEAKDHNDVKLIGHRGFSYLFPEQTIETLHEIKRYGNVGIEVDLRTTSDGEIILMHDETVDRTTNGSGRVSTLTLAQIKTLECGSYFDDFYKGAKVPTLEEFLQNAKWCNFIVLQINAVSLDSLEKVVSLIEKYNMIDSCYIYTVGEYGQRQHFDKLYELNHKIKRIYRPNRNDVDDVKNFKESKGVRYFIEWPDTLLKNPGLVKEYGDLGIEVMASTTESKEKYTELNKIGISKCLAETVWEV